MSLVKGHTLRAEGAAFLLNERGGWSRVAWNTVSGTGRARCSCSAASEILTSAHQRKKWHREHKAEVSANRQEAQS